MTQVVNDLVNGAGMTFWPRLAGETGRRPAELTRANFVAREIFGSLPCCDEVEAYDNELDAGRADPDAASRCARWSSGPRAGWSPTGGRRWTARRTVEFFGDRVQAVMARAARRC